MRYVVFLIFLTLFSCKNEENNDVPFTEKKEKTVTEVISELNKTDTIKHLDLSYKKLDSIPDLSELLIESLDLSHNNLDTIAFSKLPQNLKILKCTHNNLRNFSVFYSNKAFFGTKAKKNLNNTTINFEAIDLSDNSLKSFNYSYHDEKSNLKKVILKNNNIEHLHMNENIQYLDISNNKNLPKEVNFNVSTIDTLLQNHNETKLKTKRIPKPGPIICSFEDIYKTLPKTLKNQFK
ncbi:hypothetical protein [uncultured Flavobacterium sp.]|uniref:hypothetical protein n=1 Tax=uncultured Flavobacterium sp. TaxID=165435 RepID=UPI0030C85E54